MIPVFTRLRITSAYELLEQRLGIHGRRVAACMFILVRLTWMGLVVYLAAKAVVEMLGWDPSTVPYAVAVAGAIAVVYTALGGLRAVMITDVIQFLLLVSGALLTILLISVQMGGVGAWCPTAWAPNWDVQPFFSLDPHVRVTVTGTVPVTLLWWLCTAGSDQVAIQRYLTTRNSKQARRAFLIGLFADGVAMGLLCIVGFALLGFFSSHPEYLKGGQSLVTDADYLFPHYIANFIPVGMAGLVVAALFAAAMSSWDSGVNSIVTVVSTDFLNRRSEARPGGEQRVHRARFLVVIGLGVGLLSSLMDRVPGNIMEVTFKTNGLFTGPLFELFFLALFVPFATPFGAILGAVYGLVAAALWACWDVITGLPTLSFQWIIGISLLVHLISGCLLSLVPTRGRSRPALLSWSLLATLSLAVLVGWAR